MNAPDPRSLARLGAALREGRDADAEAIAGTILEQAPGHAPTLAALSRDEFMRQLDELDAPMAARLAEARAEGGVLRHVARLDRHGHASVRLQVLPAWCCRI